MHHLRTKGGALVTLSLQLLTDVLREGFATTLRMHVPAPAEHIERIASDAANNIAMAIASEMDITMQSSLSNRLELESLSTKLHNAGGRGATLDIMLGEVLEEARLSYAARDAARKLVDASTKLIDLSMQPGVGGCPVCNLPDEDGYRQFRTAVLDARREVGR